MTTDVERQMTRENTKPTDQIAQTPAELQRRLAHVESDLADARARIKDLNFIVYKILYQLGGKEFLDRQPQERH